jgi:hypothetical protein
MRHRAIDLASEVKRATLPDGLSGFLFPLYEAVSNSFHSVEERWADDLEEMGQIDIDFDAAGRRIVVADNGCGFDDRNLDAFLTPLTGNKYERGGKGFGRFMAFKVFNEVFYSSGHKDDGGQIVRGRYRYMPFSEKDNLIDLADVEGAGVHRHDRGVTVMMGRPISEFESYFDTEGQSKAGGNAAEDIVAAVLDHFLIEFIQRKVPRHFQLSIEGVTFDLYRYFHDALSSGGTRTATLPIGKDHVRFEFNYFKVGQEQAKKHRLYFYANNRASSELETISSGVKDGPFAETVGGVERRYFYLVAVSSDFFLSSQSRDRITNLHGKIDLDGKKRSIKDHLIVLAKQHILEIEAGYTAERRKSMQADVEHLITIDPVLRRGLGSKTAAEFVEKRSITETREQLAQDLFVERFRTIFDFTKLDAKISIDQLVDIVRTKIPEDAKEALAVYIAYRNHVIKVFRELLNKTEAGLATEDMVHQLIYPRYKDSEEIDYSSHNLWLLDDDLAYARYISSDRTPDGAARGKGEYAHDLLINNENDLMIVEMKRPQKTAYDFGKEGHTDNPVDQLKKQIADIRSKGKIFTSGGREVPIAPGSMVRGYVLADWNDKLKSYLTIEDFTFTNFGGQMAYRYYSALNLMVEVLAFDRLVDRATNRNEAFVQMLEGRSNYDRKPKGTL